MARVAKIQGEPREIALAVPDPLQRKAQPYLVAVRVQRHAGRPPKRAAQVEHRTMDRPGDCVECQAPRDARRHPALDAIGQFRRWRRLPCGKRRTLIGIREAEDAIEQLHDPLLDVELIGVCPIRRIQEQSPLREIGRRIGTCVRKADWPFAVRRSRIAIEQCAVQQVGRHGEPVAPIAVGADRAALVLLPPVVERHDGRVGDKRQRVLVLDDHGSSRKDEAVVANRPGIPKRRVVHGAAEGADGDALAREHYAVDGRHAAGPFILTSGMPLPRAKGTTFSSSRPTASPTTTRSSGMNTTRRSRGALTSGISRRSLRTSIER
jgi:hypothetical protein